MLKFISFYKRYYKEHYCKENKNKPLISDTPNF